MDYSNAVFLVVQGKKRDITVPMDSIAAVNNTGNVILFSGKAPKTYVPIIAPILVGITISPPAVDLIIRVINEANNSTLLPQWSWI